MLIRPLTEQGSTVILGCAGTLGTQLADRLPGAILLDRDDLDVTDWRRTEKLLAGLKPGPSVIINCIAFNDVDGAEDRPDAAFALNSEFVRRLAMFANDFHAVLLHYSTNYVFDGSGSGEFNEEDQANPLSVYGESKRAGEEFALDIAHRVYVVRTSVIFGPKGPSPLSKKSFVDLMMDLSSTRQTISAVFDEINCPTYARDLATASLGLIESGAPRGIYHLTNSGEASWFDFAAEIFRVTGRAIDLRAVPSSTFSRKARRPARAVLSNTKAAPLRSWQAALAEYLQR